MQLSEKETKKILLTFTLYLTSLLASNTLGLKIMPFLFGSHLSVAIFSFPIVFLTTDVIGEVYGKQIAKLFIWGGFISTAGFIIYSLLSLAMPWSADGLWAKEGYNLMFSVSVRISIASLAAYIIGEYQDLLTFFFFKKIIGTKMFWLRSNLSNLWSQLLDSAIFMVIAFAGVYDNHTLINIILTWWLFKVGVGAVYSPLSYLGLWLLKGGNSNESKSN